MPPTPAPSQRCGVLIVTCDFHIRGDVVVAPDGSMLDLEHLNEQPFVRVFDAEFISREDGRRVYDARETFVFKHNIIAVFRQDDVAFARRAMTASPSATTAPKETSAETET